VPLLRGKRYSRVMVKWQPREGLWSVQALDEQGSWCNCIPSKRMSGQFTEGVQMKIAEVRADLSRSARRDMVLVVSRDTAHLIQQPQQYNSHTSRGQMGTNAPIESKGRICPSR
jgi:hypothetical protein